MNDNAFLGSIEQIPLHETGKYQMNVSAGHLALRHISAPEVEVRDDLKNRVFMASTIKVPYIAAFCKLMPDLNLDSELPFATITDITDDADLKELAKLVFDLLKNGEETDPLYTRFVIPEILKRFEDGTKIAKLTLEDVMKACKAAITKDFGFTLEQLLAVTAGPSSNTSLYFLKAYLAKNKFEGDFKQASDALENTLNGLLNGVGYIDGIRINGSTLSASEHNNNTGPHYEIEALFNIFFDNGFELPFVVQQVIKNAMQEAAPEGQAQKLNRLHEVKTIAGNIFAPRKAIIEEKSGYIGLSTTEKGKEGFNSGLEKDYNWDDILLQEGENLVILNLSSVARVYLQNGEYLQISYSIAQPVVIKGDNEEEDENYLAIKANLNAAIEAQIAPILKQYENSILFAA